MMNELRGLESTSESAGGVESAFDAIHAALADGIYCSALTARQVLHLPRLVAGFEAGLPGLVDIELALKMGAFTPEEVRILAGRNPVDQEKFRAVFRGLINPLIVADLALLGTTMVFNGLKHKSSKAHRFCQMIEGWLGDPVEIALVASFGSESGAPAHHDANHALIVQLEGSKDWTLQGDPFAPEGESDALASDTETSLEVRMAQGDVMFVPAGKRHVCQAQGFSLHMAVIVQHVDGDVLRIVLDEILTKNPALLYPAPAILGEASDKLIAEQYRAHLNATIANLDITRIIQQERARLKIPQSVKLKARSR